MNTDSIYALKKDGAIIYIGRTKDLPGRTRAHRKNGIDFDECATLARVSWENAISAERSAIETHKPILNKVHNGYVQPRGCGCVKRHAADQRASAAIEPTAIEPTAIYSVETAAALIECHPDNLRKKLRAGVVRGSRRLGAWRILGAELLALAGTTTRKESR